MSAGDRATEVVGMHFFSPAHIMRVVEIIRGNDTSDAATATVARVARQLGKIAVVAGNSFGFIGNRMLYAYGREKELMLLQGVDPARIDGVLENFGMAMGPNAVGDLAGLDVGWQARRAWSERPSDGRYWRATDRLAELGRFGRKTGRGFYQYEAGVATGARRVDPEAVDIIRAESERLGVVPREWADEEIVERCVLALIREGAELLQRKVARSEADIDVIWCNGYGFPRERGGPMFHGMTLGWRHVLRRLRHFAVEPGGEYWLPSVWLERRAAESA
jgi:3-hydroxyacyl-CoA dehydrogenase